jgi:hypothetical protein
MRRYVQILTVLTALAAPWSIAQAQTLNAAKLDSINKATESFLALAKDSLETGKPPRYSNPAAKPLLDAVLDTKAVEGKPVPWSALELLQNWSKAAAKIGVVYYLAGTGTADLAVLTKDPQKLAKANGNTVTYAAELGRYYDAQVRLLAAMVDAAAAQSSVATPEQLKDPAFRATLNSISSDTARNLSALLGTFVIDGLPDDWLLLRVVIMLDITPKAAKFMSPDDRQRVRNAAAEVAEVMKNPDVKSGVSTIARAFEIL